MNLGYPLLGVTLFLIACGPSNEDMQAMVNRAVDEERGRLMQAVMEEARKNPGPAVERGPQSERGPEVGDERLAQGIQAALTAIELPVGPPGPAGPQGERGETGRQAEIPAELLDNQFEAMELEGDRYGVQFNKSGVARIQLAVNDATPVTGIEFKNEKGEFDGGVWAVNESLMLAAPDGSIFCIDRLGASDCGNLYDARESLRR